MPLSADGRIGSLIVWSGPPDSSEWDTYIVVIEDIANDKYRIIDTLPDWSGRSSAVDIYYCDSFSVVYADRFHEDTARLVLRRIVPPKHSRTFALLPLVDSIGNLLDYEHIFDVWLRDSLLLVSGKAGIRLATVNEKSLLSDIAIVPEAHYPVFSDDGKQVLSHKLLPDWPNCEGWAMYVYDIGADSTYCLHESSICPEPWVQRRSAETPVFYLDVLDSAQTLNLYYRSEHLDTAVQVTHYRFPEWVSYYWLMEDSIALWINQYGKPSSEQRTEVIPMPGE